VGGQGRGLVREYPRRHQLLSTFATPLICRRTWPRWERRSVILEFRAACNEAVNGRAPSRHFAVEKPLLVSLPDEVAETGRWFTPRVDKYSQVTVRTNPYSVPVRLIGRQVRVLLHANHLVYDGRTEVARHERLLGKAQSRLDLDHYLKGLLRKPGALPGATALEQARAAGGFTPVHEAWWPRGGERTAIATAREH
uniref:Mu transposase domain-containing protein n=1 Tax=Nocardia sp. CY41 TaxID=2608686 RepID=UPI003FA5A340